MRIRNTCSCFLDKKREKSGKNAQNAKRAKNKSNQRNSRQKYTPAKLAPGRFTSRNWPDIIENESGRTLCRAPGERSRFAVKMPVGRRLIGTGEQPAGRGVTTKNCDEEETSHDRNDRNQKSGGTGRLYDR